MEGGIDKDLEVLRLQDVVVNATEGFVPFVLQEGKRTFNGELFS